MAKVTWTFQALEQLDEVGEFHAKTSPKYARYLIDAILRKTETLENFPRMGRVVPETNMESIRELIVNKYRIIYSLPNMDEVFVLTVHPSSIPLADFP